MSLSKRRFVVVGTGARAAMFIDPMIRDFQDQCELAGLCDLSSVRMNYHLSRIADRYGYRETIPCYHADDFDRMLCEVKPDTVIVCTVDSVHHDYIIKSLYGGCNVVCEKPITIDAPECESILAAVRETGRDVRVTFNLRWTPGATKIKELVGSGTIGSVKQVAMEYLLDTSHGADYFRRWHSDKKSSGGLLVHKATHQFDLVNWWIDAIPQTIYADGSLAFYGEENARQRGDIALTAYSRSAEAGMERDPFFIDINADHLAGLYREAEAETGYIRDRNVFREGITIEDVMSVVVRYRNGTLFHYSLNAFSPREGYRVSLTGDRGRIEYEETHPTPPSTEQATRRLTVHPLFGKAYDVEVPYLAGGHGGGDPLLKEQIFSASAPIDPWGRSAGAEQGIASALIGIAGNRSIASGHPVQVDELLSLAPDKVSLSSLR